MEMQKAVTQVLGERRNQGIIGGFVRQMVRESLIQ